MPRQKRRWETSSSVSGGLALPDIYSSPLLKVASVSSYLGEALEGIFTDMLCLSNYLFKIGFLIYDSAAKRESYAYERRREREKNVWVFGLPGGSLFGCSATDAKPEPLASFLLEGALAVWHPNLMAIICLVL